MTIAPGFDTISQFNLSVLKEVCFFLYIYIYDLNNILFLWPSKFLYWDLGFSKEILHPWLKSWPPGFPIGITTPTPLLEIKCWYSLKFHWPLLYPLKFCINHLYYQHQFFLFWKSKVKWVFNQLIEFYIFPKFYVIPIMVLNRYSFGKPI